MPEYLTRTEPEYENLSHTFTFKGTNYNRQYYSIYITRLKQMTELLHEAIEHKWKNTYPVCKLHKLSEEKYEKCVVIGTLFKNQKLKPSILKQLADGNQLVDQPIVTHFTDKSDELFIEDEVQRFQVLGSLPVSNLVTGITCALLGTDDGKGKFLADDYVFADYRPQISRPISDPPILVALVSGLDLFNVEEQAMYPGTLFNSWLNSYVEDVAGTNSSGISRLIIAGNSIRRIIQQPKVSISLLSKKSESVETFSAVELLDKFLLNLVEIVDIDLMPGENDPSNHVLPQQPMHHCLFPLSSKYRSLNRAPNPYSCSMNGAVILGTSGQNIRDILRYSELNDPLDAMEASLKWGHMAPTAPDTLGCYPFYDEDPFIFQSCPHVFFAGNQSEFGTRIVRGLKGQSVRLISIPEFHKTGVVCLLNLKTLECARLRIHCSR